MALAVGIDLGTSNSCVAVFIDGAPQVLADDDGHRIQPSVVAFGYDGKPVVGWRAQRQVIYAPESTVTSAKRLMGRRYGSPEVDRLQSLVGYSVREGPSGECLVQVRNQEYTVPQISGMVLAHMKRIAEEAAGQPIEQAVITVPAYFNDHQRQATREAAGLAGLQCLRIINEPTAAALAYGSGLGLHQNLAVYDLGGGTFDISVLRLDDDVYEVVGTAGDTFLGGDDFDAIIADHFFSLFRRDPKLVVRDNRVTRLRLRDAAERAKIALSESTEVTVAVPGVARNHEGKEVLLNAEIDRYTYARLVMPLLQRTFQVCDESLGLAGLTVSQIDAVLLVGGMAKLPLIREAVGHYFGKEPNAEINSNEVVAVGAAIQARNLTQEGVSSPGALLLDVTPRSLGIATRGGFVESLIPRNSPIPTEASKYFHTSRDNQTQVRIAVYQGESRNVRADEHLGEFLLDGLRSAPRGDVRVKITFEIDADGIVHVIAQDEETGHRKDLRLTVSLK